MPKTEEMSLKLRSNSNSSTPVNNSNNVVPKRNRAVSASSSKTSTTPKTSEDIRARGSISSSAASATPSKMSEDKMDKLLKSIVNISERLTNLENKFDVKFSELKQDLIEAFDEKIDNIVSDKIKVIKSELRTEITTFTTQLDNLEERIITIENSVKSEIRESEDQEATNNRIFELERLLHSKDLIMSGLAYCENENLYEILIKIATVINAQLNLNNVTSIFRIKNSDTVIIKFLSSTEKESFFLKYLKHKNLRNSDVGINCSSRIYINESLCPHTRFLFKIAHKMKSHNWINKIFTKNGFLYVVKTEGATPMRITAKSQLIQSNAQNKSILLNISSPKGLQNAI